MSLSAPYCLESDKNLPESVAPLSCAQAIGADCARPTCALQR